MLSALERAGRHHDRAGQLRRVAQEVEPLEIEPELAEHVYWSVANPLNLEVDLLFFDTTSTLAVTREGIPIRVWTWPGNASDQELIRQVEDDLRAWKLGRVARVADRGFNSAANRRYLQRAGGHYIIGEKLRGDSAEAKATLARQGRYHHVAGNLEVKEVVLDEGTLCDRFVICRNPETATRDAAIRTALLEQLETAIAGSDDRSPAERHELACRLREKPAYRRILRVSAGGLLRIDRAAVAREERLDGKFLLRTSDPTLSAKDVALGYKQLLEVERPGGT